MKFTAPFKGVKSGEIYRTEFQPGDDCRLELADAARAAGAVGEVKAAKKAPETK